MTERKFTPPTEFPAEYVTRDGRKAVIVARTPCEHCPLIGWIEGKGRLRSRSVLWASGGAFYAYRHDSAGDLFDIVPEPQKQVHWANDYAIHSAFFWQDAREDADNCAADNRTAVIRREWVEGQLPQYFAEDV